MGHRPLIQGNTENELIKDLRERLERLERRYVLEDMVPAAGGSDLAYAYAVTFNSETVGTTGGSQFINDSNWDETYTNVAAEQTRTGEGGQLFDPQIDDGQIIIRPGNGIAITCAIKVVVGWSTGGEPATDEVSLGIEVSSGLGFGASPSWWDTIQEVNQDPNAMQARTHMETFYGGESSPSDQWVRAYVDAFTTGAANSIDTYQAGIWIQEICSFDLTDGTFA